jgi:RNA polymerase sigma factor (sigma-70 family)
MWTTKTVGALLNSIHRLRAKRLDGDIRVATILLDLTDAIETAPLTETEASVLRLRYVDELTQAEVARRLKMSQQAVSKAEVTLIEKITEEDAS